MIIIITIIINDGGVCENTYVVDVNTSHTPEEGSQSKLAKRAYILLLSSLSSKARLAQWVVGNYL
jgi:hypothetical protein